MKLYSRGSWPAVMTAFNDDMSIDYVAQEALLDHYIETGGAGLFINCYSSEVFYLSIPEQLEVARHAMKYVDGRIEVVSGAILNGPLEDQHALMDALLEEGVDGLILGSNQLVAEEESDALLMKRLQAVTERYPEVRFGLYEIPFPYKRVLSDEVLKFCVENGHFFFLKDTSCDSATIARRAKICEGSSLRLFNAHLGTTVESIKAGYAGYCGVLSNLIPGTMAAVCSEMDRGNQSRAEQLEAEALLVDKEMLGSGLHYPQCAKAFLAAQGVEVPDVCRLEMDVESEDIDQRVVETLRQLKELQAPVA